MRRSGLMWSSLLFLNFAALQGQVADSVLVNGKIITVDPADSIAEAVAIKDGKILDVGSKSSVMGHVGPATQVIDLHGLTATPGLIDSHLHFASVENVYSIDLSTVSSIDQVLSAVKERVAKAPAGQWIIGQGWDEGKLAERRYVYASDLDKVSPNNPVWLTHTTGHYGVANSLALKMAHLKANAQNPTAGTVDKDANGQLTGVFKEAAAMELVTKLIPAYSPSQMRDGYLTMMSRFNKEGITAIKDPGIGEENWAIYDDLRKQHKLTIHLFALWSGGTTVNSAQLAVNRILESRKQLPQYQDVLISGGVKLYMDGSGGARTAWLTQDWNKKFTGIDVGNKGYPLTNPDVYRRMVGLIHNAGIHVGTHAIGDHAIDWVTGTYAQVLSQTPTVGLRHSIIHANIPSDKAIETMAMMQQKYDAGYPEAQAEFMYWIGDTYAANFGAARNARLMPFQTYVTKRVQWSGGSDYPVTPFPARLGLWSSVVRKTLNGTYGSQPFGTAEAVDVHAALRSYTIWSAHQLFLEKRIGSIEPGKDADIAVWDKDIYSIPADEIKTIVCRMTLFKGQVVYKTN